MRRGHMKWFLFAAFLFAVSPYYSASADSLHIVTSLDPLEAKEYLAAFQQETKIEVTMIRLSSGEVLARLQAEKGSPTQSVWFGGPSLDYISAKKDGLIQNWSPIYFGSLAFISYKPFLEKNKLPPPTSWQDLLKPEFKNEISVAFPYTSGTGFTLWAGLVALMGEEKALEYWKGLDQNIRHYTKSGSGPVLEVGLGEVSVGVAFSQDIWRKAVSRNFPVVVSYPKEGTPYEIGGVAIIAGAKETEAAKKFIDWIVSASGQNLMQRWGRYPVLPGAKSPTGVGGPREVKLINMDSKIGLSREPLLNHWRSVIGK